ncbi:unnamed protein product [Didymodactylos carnosus]|uniref:Ribosomal protein L37 n=1 Tax=Didymodactylos carnosus TaxID=1234261 RepID=A0A815R4D4_9BILA|nr:unnamed protein product [Didymodactylos carnosus]CAF4339393.1 unnamed protein product [Didymodactylos carnosus]
MTKGTSSFGKRNVKTHALCRRCGRSSYHLQRQRCAACGFPSKKNTNGFREGTLAKSQKKHRNQQSSSGGASSTATVPATKS